MRRLSLWMRAHPMAGDSMLAGLLLLLDLAILVLGAVETKQPGPPWYLAVPLDLAVAVPVAFRRKAPLLSAYLVLVLGVPQSSMEIGVASLIGGLLAIYTVPIRVGRRQGAIYLGLSWLTSIAQLLLMQDEDLLLGIAAITLMMAFAWLLAQFVDARRAYQAELEARLHLLETERDQATRIAVSEERSRIARELHDVVAHAVSVIVVQADGASYAIRSAPEQAEQAVRTISETGRSALAELRRLLDVLREQEPGEREGEPRVPQPGTGSLIELAERVRSAGLPVHLELGEQLGGLPTGVQLGIYRIVQESLTNALKHAGRGARAEVVVQRAGETVRVEVRDDGAGKAHALHGTRPVTVPGGNGLIGMRERAHVFGGNLQVGPSPGGGWRVQATLPVPSTP